MILQSIFYQLVLYMSDFASDLSNINIKVINESGFKQIIVVLLKNLKCPFLIDIPKENQQGINLEDSRDLLIILAWIVQASGIFDRYHEKFLEKISDDLNFKDDFNEIEAGASDEIPLETNNFKQKTIDENDIIEIFTKIQKKFKRLFGLLEYKAKTKEKLQQEMSLQKLNMRLNELFMLKNDKKFDLILDRLVQINSLLEKEKDNLKHEELFWLWMESVIDLDKKEYINDPAYGFSEMKDSLNIQPKGSFKGIESLFEELKILNDKYQKNKEKFKLFQTLWEKRKNQLNDNKKGGSLEQLKADSVKLLSEFDKKFLSFDKMQTVFQKNLIDILFVNENISLFPQIDHQDEMKIEVFDQEIEFKNIRDSLNLEDQKLKDEIYGKTKILFNSLKEVFVVYPELK